MARSPHHDLARLGALYGIEPSYTDALGRRRVASTQATLAALKALGAPVRRLEDASEALRLKKAEAAERPLEPVCVAWQGKETRIPVRLKSASRKIHASLRNASGEEWTLQIRGDALRSGRLALPADLPPDYYALRLEAGSTRAECLLIAAPGKIQTRNRGRDWGLFVPPYAIRSERSWGMGDFADLKRLSEWVGGLGGGFIATLPLLAVSMGEPWDPSPYAPITKRAWNELYLAVERTPDFKAGGAAQKTVRSKAFSDALAAARNAELVDYPRIARLKRQAVEALARAAMRSSGRRRALEAFLKRKPHLRDYAVYRALKDRFRAPIAQWPQALRSGKVREADYDPRVRDLFLYWQWMTHEQIREWAASVKGRGARIYLDLPLGVSGDGFDAWRNPECFALGLSGGAPPDAFFTKGQNWGFPLMSPPAMRAGGYAYLRESLAHHLEHARMLRLDHVMSLHRLFAIPPGFEAKDGVYVRYPAEELTAILCLEAMRHGAEIAGEDLGTVPPEVRSGMKRHGIRRLWVFQYQVFEPSEKALTEIPRECVASLNTHDMPPFAAFWKGMDIADRADLGLIAKSRRKAENQSRERLKGRILRFFKKKGIHTGGGGPKGALGASLEYLRCGQAEHVLLNLEDLWLETRSQNVPGTSVERPNWRRFTRLSLEETVNDPEINRFLSHYERQGARRSHEARKEKSQGAQTGPRRPAAPAAGEG